MKSCFYKLLFIAFLILVQFNNVLSEEETVKVDETVEVKSEERIKGHGKNEPTYDNPPDWSPSQEELDEEDRILKEKEEAEKAKSQKEKVSPEELMDKLKDMKPEEMEKKLRQDEIEFMAKVKKEMKIDEMTEVTQEVFREFITRVIYSTVDENGAEEDQTDLEGDPEEEEFLGLLVDSIMKDVPEKFPVEKFDYYADSERYKPIVDNILKEKFGDNYSEEVMKMMQEGMGSMTGGGQEGQPSMEEMQEMMKKFNEGKGGEAEGEGDDETEEEEEVIPGTENQHEMSPEDIQEKLKNLEQVQNLDLNDDNASGEEMLERMEKLRQMMDDNKKAPKKEAEKKNEDVDLDFGNGDL